jgi:hypothetical protein
MYTCTIDDGQDALYIHHLRRQDRGPTAADLFQEKEVLRTTLRSIGDARHHRRVPAGSLA